jgi:transcriptional regulator with XRE-family HTH domain
VDASKFGKFIADQRKILGMTQSNLGNMLMVTDKAVSKWERGLGFPDINTLEPLAEALQVSVQELMRAEKNVTTELNEEAATEAILNTIGVADKQLRDAEKRQVRISVLIIAVVAMLVLIVDNMKLSEIGMAALFVYLPIICLIGGIVLLVQALMRKRKGNPYKATLITAIVMVGIVALIILFFFAAGMLGFPING